VFERIQYRTRGRITQVPVNMFKRHRQKPTGAATRIVNRFSDLRIKNMHHASNHFARRKKLAAVGVFLAHFQQQIFIDLRQRKKVGVVDMINMDFMHFVENIAQIGFAIDPHFSTAVIIRPITRCLRLALRWATGF